MLCAVYVQTDKTKKVSKVAWELVNFYDEDVAEKVAEALRKQGFKVRVVKKG